MLDIVVLMACLKYCSLNNLSLKTSSAIYVHKLKGTLFSTTSCNDLLCAISDMQEGRYAIVTDRWQKFSDVYLDEKVLEFLANYADEFLVHGVDVEGKR